MTEPDPFESNLRSYLRERSLQARDSSIADRLVDRVIRGERRSARFGVLASFAIALAVVLLVGTPTTVILLKRSSHVSAPPPPPKIPPALSTSTGTPSPGSTPSATPSSALLLSVDDVAFADTSHGWAVGTRCDQVTFMCDLLVDASADGGDTWSAAVTIGQVSERDAYGSGYPIRLTVRAVGANIWVSAGVGGIYESHDRGTSWVHALTSPALRIAVGPTTAWALVGCTSGAPCQLDASAMGSNTWAPAPSQPPLATGSSVAEQARLLDVASNGVVLVVDPVYPGSEQKSALLLTLDSGRSWLRAQLPCTFGIVTVQSLDGKTLWALCGGGGGAGAGPKAVYVSADAGTTWEERANNFATPPVGSISFGGYASTLALTHDGAVLVGSLRGGIIRSVDGGRTWTDTGSHATCLLDGTGVTQLRFLPSGEGWALTQIDLGGTQCPLLVRTPDSGATWQAAGAPLGWTATPGK